MSKNHSPELCKTQSHNILFLFMKYKSSALGIYEEFLIISPKIKLHPKKNKKMHEKRLEYNGLRDNIIRKTLLNSHAPTLYGLPSIEYGFHFICFQT